VARQSEKVIKVYLKQWSLYSSYVQYKDYFERAAEIVYDRLELTLARQPNEDECTELLAVALKKSVPWIRLSTQKGLDNIPVSVSDVLREYFARFIVMQRYPGLK
jgi:hypothetical protein